MVYPFFMPIRISLLKMMAASHSATEESFDSISSAWAQMISTLVTCRYTDTPPTAGFVLPSSRSKLFAVTY